MKGFTLTEILVIIGIIGIVIGIGLLTLKALQPDIQLSGAVRELVSDLRLAGQLSVTEQVNHGIIFYSDSLGDRYQMVKYGENDQVLELLKTKELPGEVNFTEINFTNSRVIFNPYGAVKESGSVVLINSRGATTTCEVRPSGLVKIK